MKAQDRIAELVGTADPDLTHGYLDLIGESSEPAPTIAQRLMQSPAFSRVYEHAWRPAAFNLAKGWPLGPSTEQEYALARRRLGLAGADAPASVLDVACGPGNVTRGLAAGAGAETLFVGIDASAAMLSQAVTATDEPNIGYVRGDALALPFDEGSFGAVGCFGALYLFDDPFGALDQMARVLAPGGRIAILTTRRFPTPVLGLTGQAFGRVAGVRMFGPTEISAALAARGFVDVHRRAYGFMQFVSARRPTGSG